jgi:queuine tRNA-ribosyltransferase
MGFDGFGIGGSFSKKDLGEALSSAILPLPADKPRHLLGIGEPEDLFEGVENGIDMFDCVLPTRLGRTGTVFTKEGKIDIRKAEYARDSTPFSDVLEFKDFTRGYVNHLFRAGEMLGPVLASMHNIHFIASLTSNIRSAVLANNLPYYKADFFSHYKI